MAGAEVPVWPCEHFYLLTRPIDGIEGNLPTLSDHDGHLYIRDDSGGLLIGCFEPMGKAIDPGRLGGDFAFRLLPEDWDHFEPIACAARGSPTWARQDGRSPVPWSGQARYTTRCTRPAPGAPACWPRPRCGSRNASRRMAMISTPTRRRSTPGSASPSVGTRTFRVESPMGCTYLAKGLIRRLGRSGFRHFRRAQMRCRLFGSNLSISAPELSTRQRAGDRIPGRRPVSPDGAGSVPPPRRPARQASGLVHIVSPLQAFERRCGGSCRILHSLPPVAGLARSIRDRWKGGG